MRGEVQSCHNTVETRKSPRTHRSTYPPTTPRQYHVTKSTLWDGCPNRTPIPDGESVASGRLHPLISLPPPGHRGGRRARLKMGLRKRPCAFSSLRFPSWPGCLRGKPRTFELLLLREYPFRLAQTS